MTKSLKTGITLALLTATISGFSIFYNKLVVVKGLDPLIFNIIKNGGVAILLSILLITTGTLKKFSTLSKVDWIKLLGIALIGGSIPFVLFFEGLKIIPATSANLIQKTLFIWVALMAIPLLKEKLNKWQIIGYAVVAWSNLFLGGFSGFTFSRGEAMVLVATLLWSVEYMILKVALKSVDPKVVAWARMFLGSLILILVGVFQNKLSLLSSVTPEQLWLSVGSILFLTAYVTSLLHALKLAPVTLVTSILIVATPITNILTALFINHSLPNPQIIQALSTVTGLILIVWFSRRPTPQTTSTAA